jgi:hypothetical protein
MTQAQVLLEIAALAAGAIGRDLAPVSSVTKKAAVKTTAKVKKAAAVVKPKPKPAARFTMYDSADAAGIPANATNIAAYINGRYVTLAAVKERFPKAKILTIDVTGAGDAECLDVENGDATPADAPGWYKRQKARGVKHPKFYANGSTMPEVWAALEAAGVKRDDVKLWLADPTGKPHLPAAYDACQYLWDGDSYDESLCGAHFLD